jgi:ankyrin repeat protein
MNRRAESRRPPCRRTPLHLAAQNGHFEAIEELLLSGADVAVQTDVG